MRQDYNRSDRRRIRKGKLPRCAFGRPIDGWFVCHDGVRYDVVPGIDGKPVPAWGRVSSPHLFVTGRQIPEWNSGANTTEDTVENLRAYMDEIDMASTDATRISDSFAATINGLF